MPISALNWAVARTVLGSDDRIEPAEADRYAILAAFLPGVTGLVVPFIVENSLPEKVGGATTGGQTSVGVVVPPAQGPESPAQLRADLDALAASENQIDGDLDQRITDLTGRVNELERPKAAVK